MKIAICNPPLKGPGNPLLTQNRQFQWGASGFLSYFIYPVILASAATLLKSKKYQVVWLDGQAEKLSFKKWLDKLLKENPDLILIETKTPVVRQHWQIINYIKRKTKIKCILVGDHVTALPKESFENSEVDYILTGGDYDFLLLNLVNHLSKKEKLESGIWCREKKNKKEKILNTGKFKLNHDLNILPSIDRNLTKWRLYSRKNSNFYKAPGAYTMFSRDCWWGKCSFCSWTTLFPGSCYRVVNVNIALDEVGELIKNYQVKEIMDDSGTFPIGEWLKEFCAGMIKRGYNKKIRFNCNMRFNAGLTFKDYQLMSKAGFRFLLFGLESASQVTLKKINKNLKIGQIEKVLKWAKKAKLMPHLTIMLGYPWEGKKEIEKTILFVEQLFKKGLAFSMQATLVVPYPGTKLFDYCLENNLLKTTNWDSYDMKISVIKSPVSSKYLISCVRSLYHRSIWTPKFILSHLSHLKSFDGFKYIGFQALKYFGKLLEFK